MRSVSEVMKDNSALLCSPYTPETQRLVKDIFNVLECHEKMLLELKQYSPEKIVKDDIKDFLTIKEFCKKNGFGSSGSLNQIRRQYPESNDFLKKLGMVGYVNEKKFIDYIMSPLGRKRHRRLYNQRVRLLKFIEKGNKS